MEDFTVEELRLLMTALSQFVDNSEDCDNTAEVEVAERLLTAATDRFVSIVLPEA